MKFWFAGACSLLAATTAQAQTPIQVEDLIKLKTVHSVSVSPNGESLLYAVTTPAQQAGEVKTSNLYLLDLQDKHAQPQQLTNHPSRESGAFWGADSETIYFVAKRDLSHRQLWKIRRSGGEAVAISDFPIDLQELKLAPDGQQFVASFEVFADCTDLTCNAERYQQQAAQPHTARGYDQLMVRHWDTWKSGTFTHLYTGSLNAQGRVSGPLVDITAGLHTDVPSKPFSGLEEVTFTPDSKQIIYAAKAPAKDQAWQTNYDLFKVPVAGGKAENLTADNLAWDSQPLFSPDGRYLVYKAMATPGYEADKFSMVLVDWLTGKKRILAQHWDRSVASMQFAPDSRTLYVTTQDLGQKSIYAINVAFGDLRPVYTKGTNSALSIMGEKLYFVHETLDQPKQIVQMERGATEPELLLDVNASALEGLAFGEYQQFSFNGWNDEKVHGYWIKPVEYKAGESYPIAYLVHGGPQGSFGNRFHARWNAQLWAAAGFGVVMVDFHGSTGYGQAFTDSIAGDWGGKPLEDLQKGLAAVRQQQPWLSQDKACALGGSYGGYMMNWIAGNWRDGFSCLVNHAGLFDMNSMYYTTEELWFPEHEMGGTPYDQPEAYAQMNPANYVKNWQTPMLVIHGQQDFRVPYSQGLASYTALQRQGIPSRLVIYPDENHWIRKPANLVNWYHEVFNWMNRWTQ